MDDAPQTPQRSWWSRNWKWVVPTGCLAPVVVCGGGFALIIGIVFGALKSSDAYTGALARAKASEEVQALLGEPIEAGMFVSGNIEVNGAAGSANLVIPISGPKGVAQIHAVATKNAGAWEYSTLEIVPQDGSPRIDLLSEVPSDMDVIGEDAGDEG